MSRMQCVTPCENPKRLVGHCCPLCPESSMNFTFGPAGADFHKTDVENVSSTSFSIINDDDDDDETNEESSENSGGEKNFEKNRVQLEKFWSKSGQIGNLEKKFLDKCTKCECKNDFCHCFRSACPA